MNILNDGMMYILIVRYIDARKQTVYLPYSWHPTERDSQSRPHLHRHLTLGYGSRQHLIGGGASSDCGCTYVRVATSRHFTIIVHLPRLQARIQPRPLPPEFPAPISFFFHDTTPVCDVAKPAPGNHVACACSRLELFFPSFLA